MNKNMGVLILEKQDEEKFNKWISEKWNGKSHDLLVHYLEQDLKTLWKQAAYTEEEIDSSLGILEKMSDCGEIDEISNKAWEETFGKRKDTKNFTGKEHRKLSGVISDCSFLVIEEVHKRTLEHLTKMSH